MTDQPKLGAIIVNYPRGQASIVMFMRKGLESLYLVSRPSPAVSTVHRVLAVNFRLCLSLFTREIAAEAVLLWNFGCIT